MAGAPVDCRDWGSRSSQPKPKINPAGSQPVISGNGLHHHLLLYLHQYTTAALYTPLAHVMRRYYTTAAPVHQFQQ